MSNKRYTVMTYIMGSYEKVHEVKEKSPNAQYLLITDREDLESKTWKVICDSTLYGSAANKTRDVKWHPWRYTDDNIVIMLDGSISVNESLDEIVEAFVAGGYELGMMIHPERNTARDEMNAWMDWRCLNPNDAERQLSVMESSGYSINSYRGLYQCCLKICRRTPAVMRWLETVAGLLTLCGNRGEYATPEQVLASFALNKWWSFLPVMWVSERLINSHYLTWYIHGTDNPLIHTEFIQPYAFNKPVDVWM